MVAPQSKPLHRFLTCQLGLSPADAWNFIQGIAIKVVFTHYIFKTYSPFEYILCHIFVDVCGFQKGLERCLCVREGGNCVHL